MNDILFSIVVPAYNAEKYIKDMIDSIIKQSYLNWELIIIDDGSTDGTLAICQEYKDSRISIYSFENSGQMLARIRGIELAKGAYTLVADADDKLNIDCLKHAYDLLNKNAVDMFFFSYSIADEKLQNERIINFNNSFTVSNKRDTIEFVIKSWNHQLWNKIIRTECIKKGASQAIQKRVKINGDYALIIPILCNVETVYFFDEPLYVYRVFEESISHNSTIQQLYDTDFISENVIDILKKSNLLTGEMKKIVCVENIKMIIMIINSLNKKKMIGRNDLNILEDLKLFSSSTKYSNVQSLGIITFLELIMVKHKMLIMLGVFQNMKRVIFGDY